MSTCRSKKPLYLSVLYRFDSSFIVGLCRHIADIYKLQMPNPYDTGIEFVICTTASVTRQYRPSRQFTLTVYSKQMMVATFLLTSYIHSHIYDETYFEETQMKEEIVDLLHGIRASIRNCIIFITLWV